MSLLGNVLIKSRSSSANPHKKRMRARSTLIFGGGALLAALLLLGCQIDHDVDGEVEVNVPDAVAFVDDAADALLPVALVGMSLPTDMTDDTDLYCTQVACITAGDARAAWSLLVNLGVSP